MRWLSFAFVAVAGCSFEGPANGTPIGEAGGRLAFEHLEIAFPPGALHETLWITAERVEQPVPGSPGPVYDLGPDGTTFDALPELSIALPESACASDELFALGTVVDDRWQLIAGSRLERSPCRVVGPVSHFTHFGPLPLGTPPPEDAQNYLVESILAGVRDDLPAGRFRDFRGDGLLTVGTSRFVTNPRVCVYGGTAAVRSAYEAILVDAVPALTHGTFPGEFPGAACPAPDPAPCTAAISAREAALGRALTRDETLVVPECQCAQDCAAMPASQVSVFLDNVILASIDPMFAGTACGGGHRGHACYADGPLGEVRGGEIRSGRVIWSTPPTGPPDSIDTQTLRHELGHAFGLRHTWGDADVMSYGSERSLDYSAYEEDAFALLYLVPTGLGLRDLVSLGVIEDRPSVLDAAPVIDRVELQELGCNPAAPCGDRCGELHHAAVGQSIYLQGRRLGLAFRSHRAVGGGANADQRAVGYAPPVVSFGRVSVVVDVREEAQTHTCGSFPFPLFWSGSPDGNLLVRVPPGATGGSVSLSTRGQSVTVPGFVIDGSSIPTPGITPLEATAVTCTRPAGRGGRATLFYTAPATYADGRPLVASQVRVEIRRNGITIAEAPLVATRFDDPTLHPDYERDLYQVVVIDRATGQEGVPSTVCDVAPRRTNGEVTLFVIDATGSMTELRSDGLTRFEAAVGGGPAPAGYLPPAYAEMEEVFAATIPPRVAVFQFNLDLGLVDVVNTMTGSSFTSDRAAAFAALDYVRLNGAHGLTDLVDTICISGEFIVDEFMRTGSGTATVRLFTDGGENFSIGVPECPATCAAPARGELPWDPACSPGTCPAATTLRRDPVSCEPCQVDLFRTYCGSPLGFFVDYFGPAGPFSPLPPEASFLMDLSAATGGGFRWHGDDASESRGIPTDAAPVAQLGDGVTLECTGPAGAAFILQGWASDDRLAPTALEYTWVGPFAEGGGIISGMVAPVTLPLGTSRVQLYVSDEHQRSDPAEQDFTVVDEGLPTLDVDGAPLELWPPNGTMHDITVEIAASDGCTDDVTVRLVSIEANEPLEPGDIEGAALGSDDRTFRLRARRRGSSREGRAYTITYEAVDAVGNATRASFVVRVPHSRGR